ncbi:hypothetical protein CJP74_01360 [Psittacicella melopsittaci]|uniref:Capsular polysaccharide export protein n=1 Tax=Psittacicella melopsittaci TaxID=2028576 RepID=A0A3A1Y5Y2_9GAMM|nr:capsular polysaccharide biosynthesis protein [Psittacicella melopsittaci]RIY33663.1 hypothetical protein CJP74_01360 [Psittacicella melopsittaci]
MTAIAYSFSRKLITTSAHFFPELEFKYAWRSPQVRAGEIQSFFAQEAGQFTPAQEEINLSSPLVVGWGYRQTTVKARALAQEQGISYLALEDGFIRSLGLGVTGSAPLSLVYDHLGIYYDLSAPSRLEELLLSPASPAELAQAEQVAQFIVKHAISKYNHAQGFQVPDNYEASKPVVLVVDQTFQDMAIVYGQADEQTFKQMLAQAQAENPEAQIWIKTHPDVLCGKKQGYYPLDLEGVTFIGDCNPQSLLAYVDKVYAVTSQLGFEALLAGKQVVTFGASWYGAWGLTDDRHPFMQALASTPRRKKLTLAHLVLGAYLRYPRYLDPATGKPGHIWQVLTYLAQQKILQPSLQGQIYALDMSFWKRAVVKPFLPREVKFTSSKKLAKLLAKQGQAIANTKLLVWGQGKRGLELGEKYHLPIIRMEDGFIRSVGLGSNLVAPVSLVLDGQGIYFNSQTPSALESICQNYAFAPYELAQAQELQQRLRQEQIGKYNVGELQVNLELPEDKTIILVPGQVEDDASLAYGSPEVKSNLELLKRVRALNPEAYIIYKPHPDVVSKNRQGVHELEQVLQYADQQIVEANILALIERVDQVHTMTSLAGFEALLRGKQVHCYGLPFYAGWGLTQDQIALPRRQRKLSLAELIAATLLVYPLYKLPTEPGFTNALAAVKYLAAQRQHLKQVAISSSWWQKQQNKLTHLYLTWRRSKR